MFRGLLFWSVQSSRTVMSSHMIIRSTWSSQKRLQQYGEGRDGRQAMGSLHEEFLRRWEGRVEVFFQPLFVGVRKLSLLADGDVYLSRHPSCGCHTVSRTGDGCLFLLEPRRFRLKTHKNTGAVTELSRVSAFVVASARQWLAVPSSGLYDDFCILQLARRQ